MTSTVSISNDVAKVISNLSPDEMAKYYLSTERKIAAEAVAGKDIANREGELTAIYNNHVLKMDWSNYSKFWRAMWKEQTRIMAKDYFCVVLDGFRRQDALISLLTMEKTNSLVHDLVTWKTSKGPVNPTLKRRIDRTKRYIKGLKERQAIIHEEVKEIMSAEFWGIWEIPKPDFSLMFNEDYHALVEDLERDIEQFEKQLEPAKKTTRTQQA
jgi:chaperonin cofactor prefoldin